MFVHNLQQLDLNILVTYFCLFLIFKTLYLTYHKLNERHNDFLIKLPNFFEYIFMHLCYAFVSPKPSCSDANIISLG
jgi:hypothetical protein